MTADNTTDKTDGVWIYSAVTSFEQIMLLMFNYSFFCDVMINKKKYFWF